MKASLPKQTRALMQIAEMFRIYSAIDHAFAHSSPVSLMITSAERREGKTALAVGLAILAAVKDKKRVLTIDLNWHEPSLHTFFGLDLLAGQGTLTQKSFMSLAQKTGIDNLEAVTAIPPGDLQANEDDGIHIAEDMITQAKQQYDLIVVDTPRIFPINRNMMDPVALSKLADGVALVVLANVTPRQQVKRAHMALDTAGAHMLGVVVNQWKNPLAFA
ncbi:MAG: CpsD/CapB family tyrosine-protein kinase [Deltaproteobacteria bacterium]|nr:CpsD/CapB family tyrosine-protein kinase [Deltaproteobacteria bacterium]